MITDFEGIHRFLSNFYYTPVLVGGITYPTSEHAFQAYKSTDQTTRRKVSEIPTPGDAKRAGKFIDLRPHWDTIRRDVMRMVVYAKFTQSDHLALLLVGTGSQVLVEGNTWGDTYWGQCKGEGENHLGRILMEVRSELIL